MDEEEVLALFIVFASITTIVLTFARMWFKHQERKNNARSLGSSGGLDQRLERIEQAVDAIAVEVERLAEGQRFATRLLSEGAGRKEPLAIGREPHSPH